MNQEDKQKLLAELAKMAHGEALREHIRNTMAEIGDVTNCESWEDTIGRKHSKLFLEKAFSFLDKKETDKKQRTQYT